MSLVEMTVSLPPSPQSELSLMAQYRLRRLLHERRDRLRVIVAPGRYLAANEDADLNDVIEGLYLEDAQIFQVISDLERYVRMHRSLVIRGDVTNRLLTDIEHKMFSLLGLQLENAFIQA